MVFCFDLISSISKLAFGVVFLFEGIFCGILPCSECIQSYESTPRMFVLQFARGISFASFLYIITVMILSMVYGYYDVFIILIGICCLGSAIAVCGCISQKYDGWSAPLGIGGIFLIIKLTHTAYFVINLLLHDTNYNNGRYVFMITSLIFECLLLLVWSLWPFLTIRSTEQSVPLTVWSLEFADIISHLVVCLVYAHSIAPINEWEKSPILQAYFAFWIINLYSWSIPLYPIILHIIETQGIDRAWLGIHILVIDFLTDLPILIITLSGRTYFNNWYIAVDIAVKCILFLRGIIWVPLVVFGDRFIAESFGEWGYSIDDVKSKYQDGAKRFRRHSV